MTTATTPATTPDTTLGPLVRRAVRRRRTAVLATASAAGRPHAAPVLYQLVGDELWISTSTGSRKAVNVAANPEVAVTVLVRRLPLGPPSALHVQGTATVVGRDDPELRRLVAAGELKRVTSHGELDLDDGCFLRISLPRRVPTYGLGMSIRRLAADPLAAGRVAAVDWAA
jgi:hypothetical protein